MEDFERDNRFYNVTFKLDWSTKVLDGGRYLIWGGGVILTKN